MYKSYEGISDRCHLMILVYVLYRPPVSFFTRLRQKVAYAVRVYVCKYVCVYFYVRLYSLNVRLN